MAEYNLDDEMDYTAMAKKRKFRNKQNAPKEKSLYESTEIVDDSAGFADTGMSKTGGSSRAGAAAMQTMASGGDATDIATSGLMMSGNPYAMAAGAGLSVLSAGSKRKQQEQEAKAISKQQRIERQQRALENLTSVSQGLRRL